MGTAYQAAITANTVAAEKADMRQPSDFDPYGLLTDGEDAKSTGVMPYNPAILEALQASGKF